MNANQDDTDRDVIVATGQDMNRTAKVISNSLTLAEQGEIAAAEQADALTRQDYDDHVANEPTGIDELMDWADAVGGLGGAVAEQLTILLEGDEDRFEDGINPNAVDLIEERMPKHPVLEDAIETYRNWYKAGN